MKSIFYNETERTIRAGWRVSINVAALLGMAATLEFFR